MKKMEAKIVYEGKEVATLTHTEDGLIIRPTAEGKALCKGACKTC